MRLVRGVLGGMAVAAVAVFAALPTSAANAACNLGPGGQVKHVVVLQFDNTHLAKDNPDVASDLQQMPALKDFLTGSGTLLSNDHTILISHTAGGIVSTETGLYPDRNGVNVSNSYEYFDKTAASGVSFTSAFKYWTDPTSASDPLPTMVTSMQKNTPAPWAPFTRAGCDFAGVGAANMELENTTSDVTQVFGPGSPEAGIGAYSAGKSFGSQGRNLATTDLVGLAIHCSQGSATCAPGNTDALPDEPGGYNGFKGLFGALKVNQFLTAQPASNGSGSINDAPAGSVAPSVYDVFAPNATNTGGSAAVVADHGAQTTPPPSSAAGATTTKILDATNNPGFPGFDGMEANNALGYTAAFQEAGVPVTYTYLSDTHDDHYNQNHKNAFGPGEAGSRAQLAQYNAAFQAFFARLAADGINKSNTLFLVTVDEGDHYAGGHPLNPGCNGTSVACQYDTEQAGGAAYGTSGYQRNVGEANVNLPALVKGVTGDQTKFGQNFDDAPTILVPNQSSPAGTPPGQTDPAVRNLEREMGALSVYDPIDGQAHAITEDMADQREESILHMVNSDPNRTPTFTMFGNPDFYFQTGCLGVGAAQGQPNAPVGNQGPGCPAQGNGFAWNHGDDQPDIASTWQGWAGPGIQNLGQMSDVWTDHTDARATLLTALGLQDDYTWDGRAIAEILGTNNLASGSALPAAIGANRSDFLGLAAAYKQLTAPFGAFGLQTLRYDTDALAASDPGDATYRAAVDQLTACDTQRDLLLPQIKTAIGTAETGGGFDPTAAQSLTAKANTLIANTKTLAGSTGAPGYTVCGGTPSSNQGPAGAPGTGGPQGAGGGNGADGQNGSKGDSGGPGAPGAPGAQGVGGPQGPAGKTPKVRCAVSHRHGKIVVGCRQVGAARAHTRAVASLVRGKRVMAVGSGRLGTPIALRSRTKLSGRYTLIVEIPHTGGRFKHAVRV